MASASPPLDDRLALIVRAAVLLAHELDMLDLELTPMKRLLAAPKHPPGVGLTPFRKRVEDLRRIAEDPSRPDAVQLLLAAAARAQAVYRGKLRRETRPRILTRLARWLFHRRPAAPAYGSLEVQLQRLGQLSAQLASLTPPRLPARAQLDQEAAPMPAGMQPGAAHIASRGQVYFAHGQAHYQSEEE